MSSLDLAVRFFHLLSTAILVGGMFFILLVEVPVLRRELEAFEFSLRMRQLGRRFQAVVWPVLGILLLTGIVNIFSSGTMAGVQAAAAYHRLLALKVALFLALCLNIALHAFYLGPRIALLSEKVEKGATEPVAEHQRLRRTSMISSGLSLLLAMALIFVGIWLSAVRRA